MPSYLERTLKVPLKLLNSVGNCNRNFSALTHQVFCVLDRRNHDESRPTGKFDGARLQQCRNVSNESMGNFNLKTFDAVMSSAPSEAIKNALIEVHDLTGLPWWLVIILTAGVTKTAIGLPLGIYQNYLVARINLTKEKLEGIIKEMEPEMLLRAKRGKWNENKRKKMTNKEANKIWNVLVVENNCHPLKVAILNLCQLPVWLMLTFSFRNLGSPSNVTVTTQLGLQTEGVFWQTDLLLPDAACVLPIIFTMTNMMLIELNVLSHTGVWTLFSRFFTLLCRGVAIFGFFVALEVPSCLSLFWATSILLGLSQNLLLMSPRVRRFCRIPITKFEFEKPYSNIWKNFLEKYSKPFKIFRKWNAEGV